MVRAPLYRSGHNRPRLRFVEHVRVFEPYKPLLDLSNVRRESAGVGGSVCLYSRTHQCAVVLFQHVIPQAQRVTSVICGLVPIEHRVRCFQHPDNHFCLLLRHHQSPNTSLNEPPALCCCCCRFPHPSRMHFLTTRFQSFHLFLFPVLCADSSI